MTSNLLELESTIKQLPGVLGCVILATPDGKVSEIQTFVEAGVSQTDVRHAIFQRLEQVGLQETAPEVFIFELDAESDMADRGSLERAAVEMAEQEGLDPAREEPLPASAPQPRFAPRPRRPLVHRVVVTSSSGIAQSQVALRLEDQEIVGEAEGEKTQHGLKIVAQATLDAADKLTGGVGFKLRAASLVNIVGREVVLVLVDVSDGEENVGAALVRQAPVTEAAVRATLSAINRRLGQELG